MHFGRAYRPSEIEEMRETLRKTYTIYQNTDDLEERLRTHLVNGTSPSDLRDALAGVIEAVERRGVQSTSYAVMMSNGLA